MTFFKPQKACAADEFFEAFRQLCEINKIQDYWNSRQQEFEQLMEANNYIVDIEEHQNLIVQIIGEFVSESMNQTGHCTLKHQVKLYQTQFEGTIYADQASIGEKYSYDTNPMMEYFKSDEILGNLTLKDMAGKDINTPSILQRREMMLRP